MKNIYPVLIILFILSCSKYEKSSSANKINTKSADLTVIQQRSVVGQHQFELLINSMNNPIAKKPESGRFCGVDAMGGMVWHCADAIVQNLANPASANFDIEFTGLIANKFYYIIPPGNYPKDFIKIKFTAIGCTPSPDTYYNFYKDTRTFELVKLGNCVEASIIKFYSEPYFQGLTN